MVKTFTNILKTELCSYHFKELPHLGQLLTVLDADRCAVILLAIANILIDDLEDFIQLQDFLDNQPFHSACASLKPYFLDLLSVRGFTQALVKIHSPEKSAIFKECLLNEVIDEIENLTELKALKPLLSEAELSQLFARAYSKLIPCISNLEEWGLCMTHINPEQQKLLFLKHKTQLKAWSESKQNLTLVLTHCPLPHFSEFVQELTPCLEAIIDNNHKLIGMLQTLAQEKQILFLDVHKVFLFDSVLKKPDGTLWKNIPGPAQEYLKLKRHFLNLMAMSNKFQSYEFVHALEFDDEIVLKDRYEKLIQKQDHPRINFFKQLTQIDSIVNELAKMPMPYKQKLFHALQLDMHGNLAQKLKDYITDKLDCKPCIKKIKSSIFSR